MKVGDLKIRRIPLCYLEWPNIITRILPCGSGRQKRRSERGAGTWIQPAMLALKREGRDHRSGNANGLEKAQILPGVFRKEHNLQPPGF